jgi:putative serine protease PepD
MRAMFTGKRLLIFTGCALAAGAGGGVAASEALNGGSSTPATATVIERPAVSHTVAATSGGLTAEQIYSRAAPSVAHITSSGIQESSGPFGSQSSGTATGSGFVVSSSGLIVTNAHVVNGASKITVKVGDGTAKTAKLVGKDNSTDLALLRIDPGEQKLAPLAFDSSSSLEVGDATYAIGDPYGLDSTLTTGVVSALNRQINAPNGFSIDGAIQTDAALNPGNSGGPLLDAEGHVVGVNSQIESGSSNGFGSSSSGSNTGIGFAVPSDTVKRVVSTLAKGEQVRHAWLGVSSQDRQMGAGAIVAQVVSGSPAAQAGLRARDVITAIDGRSVADAAALSSAVDAHAPGDKVTLDVERGGRHQSIEVTLGNRPARAPGAASVP